MWPLPAEPLPAAEPRSGTTFPRVQPAARGRRCRPRRKGGGPGALAAPQSQCGAGRRRGSNAVLSRATLPAGRPSPPAAPPLRQCSGLRGVGEPPRGQQRETHRWVLFPGGGVDLKTSEYSRIARIFYNKALKANDKGDYFPVWGTCLGYEELTYLTSGEILLTWTNTEDFALPLNFTTAAQDSRMFKNFPDFLLKKLATESLTAHFHHWSLSMQNFTQNEKLRNFYKVLTTNTHADVEFISTMEAHKYPIYGVQWHPEKNPFEWKNSSGIPHSASAMKVAYYVADFLVNEGFHLRNPRFCHQFLFLMETICKTLKWLTAQEKRSPETGIALSRMPQTSG
nr:gamma-glutamyl hydrolase-like isoform X4 [Caretta caretta]